MSTKRSKTVLSLSHLLVFLIGLISLPVLVIALVEPNLYGLDKDEIAKVRPDTSDRLTVQAKDKRPNIVFILADDLGYGDTQVYGPNPINTPSLNNLAAEGVKFTDFYAPAPICSPSRIGFLTGRYPLRTGVSFPFQAVQKDTIANWGVAKLIPVLAELGTLDMKNRQNLVKGIPKFEITIAEGLKQAGYATGAVGKWHIGDFMRWPEYHPHKQGFDFFVGFNASNDDWPAAFYEGETEVLSDIGFDQAHYTQRFTQEAIKFIESNQEQPFFLFLSHKDPHQPFFPSEGFAGKSAAGPFGDAVEELDDSVGQVVTTLKRLNLLENTIVVFTSDNGPWYEGNPGNLRGRKGMSYEGGYRVPMIMRLPNKVQAGETYEQTASGIDLLPTFFNLAGVSLPKDRIIDGITLVDEAGKLTLDTPRAKPLYLSAGYDFEAIREGDFKLIERNNTFGWPIPLDKPMGLAKALSPRYSPEDSEASMSNLNHWPKLYDLSQDPSESYDIAPHKQAIAQELQEKLQTWRTSFTQNPVGIITQ